MISEAHEPKANSNRGWNLYSARRRFSARSLLFCWSTGVGLMELNASIDESEPPEEENDVLVGPGEGQGVAAGVRE